MLHVLCYDIADDRRRRKLEKLLKGYGRRVQESVFEARLDTKKLTAVQNRAANIMEMEEDSLRIYRLCGACEKMVSVHGLGPMPEQAQRVLVV